MKDLEALGLSLADLKGFIREVERARASLASTRGGNSVPPPTFADFLDDVDRTVKTGKKVDSGGRAPGTSQGDGKGTLRGVADGLKETVDLEYQDVLEEYYRSLADPAWKRGKK